MALQVLNAQSSPQMINTAGLQSSASPQVIYLQYDQTPQPQPQPQVVYAQAAAPVVMPQPMVSVRS